MHILIAADSFKDALAAPAVCSAIAAGIKQRCNAIITELPLADGGEGSYTVLSQHLALHHIAVDVVDPLNRPIRAHFGLCTDQQLAVIELAQASGLQLLSTRERNPLHTTSLGTGQLIARAIELGAEKILLAIGGSATTDAGIGLAAALGWSFIDAESCDLAPTGENLVRIHQIVPPLPPHAFFTNLSIDVLCDVSNPLYGAQGAAAVYAAQKGASAHDIEHLDLGLRHLSNVIRRASLSDLSPDTPGTGAAGGIGYGASVFLNATLCRGIDRILELIQFDKAVANADLVITGEGHLDGQTARGKVIQGVCQRAAKRNVPVIALCGRLSANAAELRELGLAAAYCINDDAADDALARTAERLAATAARIPLSI